LYTSPNIINVIKLRMMRWARYVKAWKMRNVWKILVGKPERKTPFR